MKYPRLILAWVALGVTARASAEGDGPLTLVDLPKLRAAILAQPDGVPPQAVSFHELWTQPEQFLEKRVLVTGRVVSVFHKPAVGQFPALAETWLFDRASDPFCLVFPEVATAPAPKLGETVTFAGTFLRRVRYRSGDIDRLAPLIAGPSAPRSPGPLAPDSAPESSPWGSILLVLVGLVVLSTLLRIAARRPRLGPIVADPPPVFEDSPDDQRPE